MSSYRPRLVIVMGNATMAVINAGLAIANGVNHRWSLLVVSLLGVSASSAAFGWAFHQRYMRHSKEEQSSSPNQQPTSGTSQNPSPSLFLNRNSNHTLVGVKNSQIKFNSPTSPNPSMFQPRRREVPVVGFRSWLAVEIFKIGVGPTHRLSAINEAYGPWVPGVNQARCFARYSIDFSLSGVVPLEHGPTPAAECACGFYVLTDLDKVPWEFTRRNSPNELIQVRHGLVGAVVGWGRVVQHGEEGWRAEKVQVIALLDAKLSDEHLALTRVLAEAYGVPVLSRTALELLAKEYGDRLTDLEDPVGTPALEAHNEV